LEPRQFEIIVSTLSSNSFADILEILVDWNDIDAILALDGMGKMEIQYAKNIKVNPLMARMI